MSEVSVIIPAYNEEDLIGETIKAVKEIEEVSQIIVVDDGSRDRTAKLAESAGAEVVRLKKNLGKGEALNKGIDKAEKEIILLLDADLGKSAKEAKRLILPLVNKEAEMTIGRFPPSEKKGGFGLVRGLSRWGIRKLSGLNMQSPLSGQRAIRREVISKVGRIAAGYGAEVALTIDAERAGFKILEIDVEMRHRETGRSLRGFLHRGKQFLAVGRVILKRWKAC